MKDMQFHKFRTLGYPNEGHSNFICPNEAKNFLERVAAHGGSEKWGRPTFRPTNFGPTCFRPIHFDLT